MKFAFIDVETTGTDPKLCAIHQLSIILEIDGEVKETLDIKLRPFENAFIDPEALNVGNLELSTIMQYPSQEVGFKQFLEFLDRNISKFNKLDKAYFIGYNVKFDNDFVRELFLRNGEKYFGSYFWSNSIDVMTTSSLKLFEKRTMMVNFQLKTVAAAMGLKIDDEKLHNSMYDIELTRDLFYKTLNMDATNINVPSAEIKFMTADDIISFGKFKHKTFGEIFQVEPQYLKWLHTDRIKNIQFEGEFLRDIFKYGAIQEEKFRKEKEAKSGSMAPPDQYPDDLPF